MPKKNLKKKVKRQTTLFDLLQLLDFGSTQHIMSTGGVEANPAMRPLADNPLAFGAVKGGLMVGNHLLKEDSEEWLKTMRIANFLQAAFVVNNFHQMFKNARTD